MTGFEIFMAAMIAVSMVAMMAMMPAMKDPDDGGVELQDAGATQSIDLAYGNTRILATRIHTFISDGKTSFVEQGQYMGGVYCIGAGPMHSIRQIYINGKPVLKHEWWKTNGAKGMKVPGWGGTYIVSNPYYGGAINGDPSSGIIGREAITDAFKDHIQLQFKSGAEDYHFDMIQNMDPDWDKTFVGTNIAAIAIKVIRDPFKGEIQAEPQIEVEVEGRRVLDIRYESTERVYKSKDGKVPGRNPALCILDYMLDPNGCNISMSEIDENSFIEFANFCENNLWYCDGTLSQNSSIKNNLESLLNSYSAKIIRSLGTWSIIWYKRQSATQFLNEDDILSDVKISYGSTRDAFNRLEVEYSVPQNNFQKDILVYPTLTKDELIERDGYEIVKKIQANFLTDKLNIDKIASIYYEAFRNLRVIQFKGNEKCFALNVGDVVEVSHELLQLQRQKFMVFEIKRHTGVEKFGTADVTLSEYSDALFDKLYNSTSGSVGPSNNTGPSRIINPPTNPRFVVRPYGSQFIGVLEWDHAQCYDFLEYQVDYKLSTETEQSYKRYDSTVDNKIFVQDLKGAKYDFRIFTRTKFMYTSAFTYLLNQDVNDDTLLPTVTNVRLNTTNKDLSITETTDFNVLWDSMFDEVLSELDPQYNTYNISTVKVRDVFSHYNIVIRHGSKVIQEVQSVLPELNYSYSANAQNGLSRDVQFDVYIVSKTGAVSKQPGVLKAKNLQAQEVLGINGTGTVAGIQISYAPCNEKDYAGTEVHLSTTKDFIPDTSTLVQDGKVNFYSAALEGGFKDKIRRTYYARIGHYDAFGRDNIKYSKVLVLQPKTVYEEMTDLSKDNLASELKKELDSKITFADYDAQKQDIQNLIDQIKNSTGQTNAQLDARLIALSQDHDKTVKDLQDQKAKLKINDTSIIALQTLTKNQGLSIDSLNTKTSTAIADIDTIKKTVVDNNTSLSTKIDSLTASTKVDVDTLKKGQTSIVDAINKKLLDQNAKIEGVQTASTTGIDSVASSVQKLSAQTITDLKALQSTIDKNKTQLELALSTSNASIEDIRQGYSTADVAITNDLQKFKSTTSTDIANLGTSIGAVDKFAKDNIKTVTASIDELRKTTTSADKAQVDRITSIETVLSSTGSNVGTALKDLTEIKTNIQDLKTSTADLDKRFASASSVQTLSANVQSVVSTQGTDKAEVLKKIQDAKAVADKAAKDLLSTNTELGKALTAANTANSDLAKANLKLTELEGADTKNTSAIEAAKLDITKAQTAVDKANADLVKANAAIAKAQTDASKALSDLGTLTPRIVTAENDINAIKTITTDLDKKYASAVLGNELSSKVQSITDAQSADKKALNDQITAAKSVADKANTDLVAANKKLADLEKSGTANSTAITSAKTDIAKAQAAADKANVDLSKLNASVGAVSTRVDTAEANIKSIQSTVTDLDKKYAKASDVQDLSTSVTSISTKADTTLKAANDAVSAANTAKTSAAKDAGIASTKASEAKALADQAGKHATTSTEKATEAGAKASDANKSATAAATSAQSADKLAKDAQSAASTATAKATEAKTVVDTANATLKTLKDSIVDLDKKYATATSVTELGTKVQSTETKVDGAITRITSAESKIQKIETSTADLDKKFASASSVQTLVSKVDSVQAGVQSTAKAEVDKLKNTINSSYTLKCDANGVVAGIGLAADGTTKDSSIVLNASKVLITAPGSNSNTALFEVSNGSVKIPKAMIGQLDATNISAGAIQTHHLASNTINSNHITAGLTLSAPVLNMGATGQINAGGVVLGGSGGGTIAVGPNGASPFGAFGSLYNTVITPNGTIHTTNLYATGGTFSGTVNATAGVFNNVTIAENCVVKGTMYADRIVGLPTGKSFGPIEIGPLYPNGNKNDPGWIVVADITLNSAEGRFKIKSMLGGDPQSKATGQAGGVIVQVLVDDRVVISAGGSNTSNTSYAHLGGLVGIPFEVGAYGGRIRIRVACPYNAQGNGYFKMTSGFLYSAMDL